MAISVRCPHCSKPFKTADSAAGKSGKCPECGSRIKVPKANSMELDDEYGLADIPSSTSSFNNADFADAIKSERPASPSPPRLEEMYATSTPSRDRSNTVRRSKSSQKPHYVARQTAVVIDWIGYLMTWLYTGLIIIGCIAIFLGASETINQDHWSLAAVLLLCIPVVWVLYLIQRVGNSVVIAIFDIEDHLSKMSRRR